MTEKEWKQALVKVYIKSLHDPAFRALCLTSPLEALQQASGVVLPPDTKLQFVDDSAEFAYCYILPPPPTNGAAPETEEDALINWATLCTEVPTE